MFRGGSSGGVGRSLVVTSGELFWKHTDLCLAPTCWHGGLWWLAKSDGRLAVDVLATILLPHLDHQKWIKRLSVIFKNLVSCFSYVIPTMRI